MDPLFALSFQGDVGEPIDAPNLRGDIRDYGPAGAPVHWMMAARDFLGILVE